MKPARLARPALPVEPIFQVKDSRLVVDIWCSIKLAYMCVSVPRIVSIWQQYQDHEAALISVRALLATRSFRWMFDLSAP